MAERVKVLITGVDVTDAIDLRNIVIEDSLKVKADRLTIPRMVISNWSHSPPLALNTIEVRYYTGGYHPYTLPAHLLHLQEWDYEWDSEVGEWYTLEFSGIVTTVTKRLVNPDTLLCDIEAADWTKLFNRFLIRRPKAAEKISRSGRPGRIVKEIVENFCPGFVFWYRKDEDLGPTYEYQRPEWDKVYPSAALDEVCQATGYQWFIDFKKNVHFLPATAFPAPVSRINFSTATEYAELEIEESGEQVKNAIIIRDIKTMGETVRARFQEAGANVFMLPYVPYIDPGWTLDQLRAKVKAWLIYEPTGAKTDLTIYKKETFIGWTYTEETVPTTLFISVPEQRGFGASVQFYPGTLLPADYTLWVQYPLEPSPELVFEDRDSQDDCAFRLGEPFILGQKHPGTFEAVLSEPNIWSETGESAAFAADLQLYKYAEPLLRGRFITFQRGWRAGQRFRLYAPIMAKTKYDTFDEAFYVQKVRKVVLSPTKIRYTVEFSSTYYGD